MKAALNGLDQEMPDKVWFGTALLRAVAAGDVPEAAVDDKATRVLTSMARVLHLFLSASGDRTGGTARGGRSFSMNLKGGQAGSTFSGCPSVQ